LELSSKTYVVPDSFYYLLMDHQKVGLHWLLHQNIKDRGSILADEMGLGKTISAIALMVSLQFTAFALGEDRK